MDDEANTRKYFRRLFGQKFRILEAEDGVEALKVFLQHSAEIGIIVTDQRMPNETGVGFISADSSGQRNRGWRGEDVIWGGIVEAFSRT